MARTFTRMGEDLAVTRFVGTASGVPLESADSWGSVDLAVGPGGRWARRPVADLSDLSTVEGRANLGQALILRLLTPLGGLADLGHPEFGSRLVELIGRSNDEATRNLARLFTLQALAREPRIHPVQELTVEVPLGRPDTVAITFSVTPVGDDEAITLGLEVAL